jgi:iron transport multicopper oxidase
MAGFAQMYFAFDQHDMTIIEIDGIYTKPRKVSQLYIATAQRYGVLLKTKSDTSKNYAALGMMDQEKFDRLIFSLTFTI